MSIKECLEDYIRFIDDWTKIFQIYYELALCLTRWECPRTQSDFDNSFTFKVFLFQFVNYYASLFYIAFFKGL